MEKINEVCSVEYLGFVNTCWIIIDMEIVKWFIHIIFLYILITSWRFIHCLQLLIEYRNKWNDSMKHKYINNPKMNINSYINTYCTALSETIHGLENYDINVYTGCMMCLSLDYMITDLHNCNDMTANELFNGIPKLKRGGYK